MLKAAYNSVLARPFHRASLRRFAELRAHTGARALIIGNGPSLNDLTPEVAAQYDLRVACNHFYSHTLSSQILVDFYVASDPRLFFPVDRNWLNGVLSVNAKHLVIPHKFFFIRALYRKSVLFYNYAGDKKLWDEGVAPVFDLAQPLPSGDTVVSDASIPLAVALGYRKLAFIGIDLQHGPSGINHAYDDSIVKSLRRNDAYLLDQWPENTSRSLAKQFAALLRLGVETEVLSGSEYFRRLVVGSMG